MYDSAADPTPLPLTLPSTVNSLTTSPLGPVTLTLARPAAAALTIGRCVRLSTSSARPSTVSPGLYSVLSSVTCTAARPIVGAASSAATATSTASGAASRAMAATSTAGGAVWRPASSTARCPPAHASHVS